MKTAHIRVKCNKTDPVYQDILVNDSGEYWHKQLCRWLELPAEWKQAADKALLTGREEQPATAAHVTLNNLDAG